MRKPILAGNWKMYKTIEEAKAFAFALPKEDSTPQVEKVICAPFTLLPALAEALRKTPYALGAQNMHFEEQGAFTGEVSPLMLKDLGVSHVILGHSERRQYFHETDENVNKKVKAALAHGLVPIICVGESLSEREAEQTEKVVGGQTEAALQGLAAEEVARVVIAYEPIWAIGTGKSSTAEDANKTISYIRSVVAKSFGQDAASKLRIQYGGSVKPENVESFMSESDIDGALVGGASLTTDGYLALIHGAAPRG